MWSRARSVSSNQDSGARTYCPHLPPLYCGVALSSSSSSDRGAMPSVPEMPLCPHVDPPVVGGQVCVDLLYQVTDGIHV